MAIKVIEDTFAEAAPLLLDMTELLHELRKVTTDLRPFDADARREYGSLPNFLAQTATQLRQAAIAKFSLNYPALSNFIANGQSNEDSFRRVYDAVYTLGKLNEKLTTRKYLLKFDEERQEARELANRARGDLAIAILAQYGLMNCDETVFLSVSKFCDSNNITPSVLLGNVLLDMEDSGESPRGYEKLSEYYGRMMDMDSAFVGECEEYDFPLTNELCEEILSGRLSMPAARRKLADHISQREETVIEGVNTLNLVQAMNLE